MKSRNTRKRNTVMRAAVTAHFRAEFVGRLNAIISFKPLSEKGAHDIARRSLAEVMDRFAKMGIVVHMDAGLAPGLIAHAGMSGLSGRRIARLVESQVTNKVAVDIFSSDSMGPFVVAWEEGQVELKKG